MGRTSRPELETMHLTGDALSVKSNTRNFTRVGRSRIEGQGVFAKRKTPRGTRIFEYAGERRTLASVLLNSGEASSRTYFFRLNDQIIIDPIIGGNDARFVNHSCEPNCETYIFDDRVYIYAERDIARGEELTFDYRLSMIFGQTDGVAMKDCLCHCGASTCRGTMFAPSKRSRRKSRPKAQSNARSHRFG